MRTSRIASCNVLAALTLACGAPPRSDVGAASTAAGSDQEIYIDTVVAGNPLVVRGRARTFENTVQIRARDARGAIIQETFETSVGEMGHHNPYEARVYLVRDPGTVVTVEAFEYSARDGSVRSLTSRRVPLLLPAMTVTAVFPDRDCAATVVVERTVPRTVAPARLLAEILVAGPTPAEERAGAVHAMPPGARVQSVVLRTGTLTVDFSERLRTVGGSCAARAIRASVTRTMMRLPAVERVVITAFGSEAEALQP